MRPGSPKAPGGPAPLRSVSGFVDALAMTRWLERQWSRWTPWQFLLWPVSVVFGGLAALRRALYRWRVLGATRLPVPVVVVGNLAVGGTGKTPLVLALAGLLRQAGCHPGIISRGHGGRHGPPRPVTPGSGPAEVGDEPVLLAMRAGCPVWVGRDRPAAGRALLAAHPEVDVLISDDGLQHYALARDVEIAVVDAQRWFGNGRLLPAGPLREPVGRLQTVDAVVINGGAAAALPRAQAFAMRLEGDLFYNLRHPARRAGPEAFAGQTVVAVAGIGNPERFFQHLRALGLAIVPRPFPDHHAFVPGDLQAGGRPVVMTEKDAVKCADFAGDDVWVLPVEARLDPGLVPLIIEKLKRHPRTGHGSQAA